MDGEEAGALARYMSISSMMLLFFPG